MFRIKPGSAQLQSLLRVGRMIVVVPDSDVVRKYAVAPDTNRDCCADRAPVPNSSIGADRDSRSLVTDQPSPNRAVIANNYVGARIPIFASGAPADLHILTHLSTTPELQFCTGGEQRQEYAFSSHHRVFWPFQSHWLRLTSQRFSSIFWRSTPLRLWSRAWRDRKPKMPLPALTE